MKLKAKLPKDDANGLDAFDDEARDNFGRGKSIPVLALLATEDVHLKGNVPVLEIVDIEGIPEDQREHLLEVMSAIKAKRTGAKKSTVPLDFDEENVAGGAA